MITVLVVTVSSPARPSSSNGRTDGCGGDSERHIVGAEEVERSVMARAFDVATFVVVAAGLSEVLSVEGEGEVVEEFAEMSGGLVADFVVHDEARRVYSRHSATACSMCKDADPVGIRPFDAVAFSLGDLWP